MQMMLLKPVLRLYNNKNWSNQAANTTNWRVAQYQRVGQAWWNYVCQYSAVYIYNVQTYTRLFYY